MTSKRIKDYEGVLSGYYGKLKSNLKDLMRFTKVEKSVRADDVLVSNILKGSCY
ncbi:MAG: hypothetical protein JWR18_627 [Segetibacter sp.]|jgi:hypothetical protein|nr:hypothetical protein [Segetibacter sp.]